jgi:hypothetical protein
MIIRICSHIKSKDSNDLWYTSTKFIKRIIDHPADDLVLIINKCLEEGVFPDTLKIARVIPTYKKGDKHDPGNYRPVSVLPVLSKIFEKLIAEQLTHHLIENDILHPQQYGFQKHKGTSDGISHLVKSVLECLD